MNPAARAGRAVRDGTGQAGQAGRTTRMSGPQRRRRVLDGALAEFARGGYDATPLTAVAARCGVSQPYLFKLFPTKCDLFLAVAEHCFDGWRTLLADAAADLAGPGALATMARAACRDLDRSAPLAAFPLHLYAASHEPRLAEAARRHAEALRETLVLASGLDDERTDLAFAAVLSAQTTSRLQGCAPVVRRALDRAVFQLTAAVSSTGDYGS